MAKPPRRPQARPRRARTRAQPAARPRLSEPGRRHGAGAGGADRPDRPSSVRAGALAGRADRRHRDGLATAAAIAGRTLVGWLMPAGADRRVVACAWPMACSFAARWCWRWRGPALGSVAGRAAVRLRHRQRHLAAAAHRPDRVFTRGCAARRALDHRALASRLCLRPGVARPAARAARAGRAAAVQASRPPPRCCRRPR